jgi:opacity protein-like surface antigen
MKPFAFALVAIVLTATAASAQTDDNPIGVRGFVTLGNISFTADESFDAIFESSSGPIFGGGGQVLLPWGVYVEVAAARFSNEGERAFVGPAPEREVFRLGIPLEVKITPLEITGGWRFRRWDRVVPYGGAGYSSYRYEETSEFSDPEENIDERFSGFHLVGGAEYLPFRWMAIGGEVAWSSIGDALGENGVSAAFDEDNLGGTTVRLKISIGR